MCEYVRICRGTHSRLGSASLLRLLDSELCRLVAGEAAKYVVSPPVVQRGADADLRRSARDRGGLAETRKEARREQRGTARRSLRGDFESVAAAVAAVPSGSSIYLMPGVYREQPMLVTAR